MVPKIGRFIETGSRIEVTGGWREGNGELLLDGYIVSVWDEKVLDIDGGDNCTTL